jgi:hypothetical protein
VIVRGIVYLGVPFDPVLRGGACHSQREPEDLASTRRERNTALYPHRRSDGFHFNHNEYPPHGKKGINARPFESHLVVRAQASAYFARLLCVLCGFCLKIPGSFGGRVYIQVGKGWGASEIRGGGELGMGSEAWCPSAKRQATA